MSFVRFTQLLFVCLMGGWPVMAAAADKVSCQIDEVRDADPSQQAYVGGRFTVEVDSGNISLTYKGKNNRTLTKDLVNDEIVSSFGIAREHCKLSIDRTNNSDGDLLSIRHQFVCRDLPAELKVRYVNALSSLDLRTDKGIYQEYALEGTRALSPSIYVSRCKVQ